MDVYECIAITARRVHDFGDEFMSDQATAAVGAAAGFAPGRGFYCRGRFGVLGEVPAQVVQATQGFLGPGLTIDGWRDGRDVMSAADAAAAYAEATWVWGRARISADVDVARFNRLAGRMIEAACPDGLPLFAAWRALHVPTDDPLAAAMQHVHVLREHRGACHLVAVRSHGLTGRQAMVANLGCAEALRYGWDDVRPADADQVARLEMAECTTTEMQAPLYAALSHGERDELSRLVLALTA